MVEVVSMEEFKEFREVLERRLESLEGKLEELLKEVRERYAVKAEVEEELSRLDEKIRELNTRMDSLEEASKSFITRLSEALKEVFKL